MDSPKSEVMVQCRKIWANVSASSHTVTVLCMAEACAAVLSSYIINATQMNNSLQ